MSITSGAKIAWGAIPNPVKALGTEILAEWIANKTYRRPRGNETPLDDLTTRIRKRFQRNKFRSVGLHALASMKPSWKQALLVRLTIAKELGFEDALWEAWSVGAPTLSDAYYDTGRFTPADVVKVQAYLRLWNEATDEEFAVLWEAGEEDPAEQAIRRLNNNPDLIKFIKKLDDSIRPK